MGLWWTDFRNGQKLILHNVTIFRMSIRCHESMVERPRGILQVFLFSHIWLIWSKIKILKISRQKTVYVSIYGPLKIDQKTGRIDASHKIALLDSNLPKNIYKKLHKNKKSEFSQNGGLSYRVLNLLENTISGMFKA